jgi:hypothetical protein
MVSSGRHPHCRRTFTPDVPHPLARERQDRSRPRQAPSTAWHHRLAAALEARIRRASSIAPSRRSTVATCPARLRFPKRARRGLCRWLFLAWLPAPRYSAQGQPRFLAEQDPDKPSAGPPRPSRPSRQGLESSPNLGARLAAGHQEKTQPGRQTTDGDPTDPAGAGNRPELSRMPIECDAKATAAGTPRRPPRCPSHSRLPKRRRSASLRLRARSPSSPA